jgi:predicted MFS family arabinose efflux permease
MVSPVAGFSTEIVAIRVEPSLVGLSSRLVLLLAVACGATVANLYYAQPLLDTIARGLSVSPGTAGLLVTATQAGYVTGLVLIVPLGDLLQRRKLVSRLLVIDAFALAAATVAPSFGVLAVALAVVGVSSVTAQILVPFASTLAGEAERGRVVGRVMSGLLLGILLARTVAGLVAEVGGWRLIYGLAAGGMLVLAVVLRRALPEVEPPEVELSYGSLMRSIGTLIREEPTLRLRMALGFLSMASFSGLWTSISFLLSGPDYGYGEAVIGLFSLAGLAGATIASFAGRAADAGHQLAGTRVAGVAVLAGWGLMSLGESSLVALLVGIVILDLGIQAMQILNQSVIFQLRPEARSRLNTAYMTSYFAGAVSGSAGASFAWSRGGWGAVSAAGAVAAALCLAVTAKRS